MGLYLNHGNENFQRVLNAEIYVDKTGLIRHTNQWLNSSDCYVCVSRARRFGKSIAAQMLEAYYCKTCDSRAMFASFDIAKAPSFEKHINRYNVISFKEYTMIKPQMLEPYVGFLQEEVDDLCTRYEMERSKAAFWYDGYRFYRTAHVYNPCSLVQSMLARQFGSYWTATASFESLLDFINADLDGIYADVECLIGGGRIVVDTSTYDNSFTTPKCKDDAFTCLIHIGYLSYDCETSEAFIPNEEVRIAFINALKRCDWPDAIKPWQRSQRFITAVLSEDSETVARMVEETHQNMTSIIAYNNENALSCVISVLCISAENQYMIVREIPTGKGFADIVLLPKPKVMKPAVVIELKFKQDVSAAIDQIHNNQYPDRLKDYYGEVVLVGINYNKRKADDCVVERFERE